MNSERLTRIGAYIALFLLGLAQGLIGCFQYSRGPVPGGAPVGAIAFDLVILATCVLGAWGMRTPGGGLLPGAGWFIAALVIATGTSGGSIVITDAMAGEWFLFGGAACAALGCLASYFRWSRAGLGGPARLGGRRG